MVDRADELAQPAPGAFFGIDRENFTHGFHSLLSFHINESLE